jgi:hypothetical protein
MAKNHSSRFMPRGYGNMLTWTLQSGFEGAPSFSLVFGKVSRTIPFS